MHQIHDELQAAWASAFGSTGQPVPEIHGLRSYRPDPRLLAAESEIDLLQPWYAIQEVATDLLFNIYLALNGNLPTPPEDHQRQVPWALVGAASGFGASLLLSCAAGYDTPAKAQLRTYTEALLLLVAGLHDPGLTADYHAANTDSKVVDFWHKKASPKKLHERIIGIERKLGFTAEEIATLTSWRRREYETLSQSSHLSILGAMMTCLAPGQDNPSIFRLRLLGGLTLTSRRTLAYAATTAWHCLRLVKPQLLPVSKSVNALLTLSVADPISSRIVAGWKTLELVVPRYLTPDGQDTK